MQITAGPLLQTINFPEDLKKLSREKLHQVCDELRQYIIDVVSVHGGHFGASHIKFLRLGFSGHSAKVLAQVEGGGELEDDLAPLVTKLWQLSA